MKTKDHMTKNLLTIEASASLTDAYKMMHAKGVRHLPVLDDRNKVVGILSDRDIQRAMSVKRLSTFHQEVQLDAAIKVEDFMSWPVFCVAESTSVLKVAEQMLSQKVSAFLVEDNAGNVKGIITTDDMLKVLIDLSRDENELVMKAVSSYFTGPELY